MAPAIDLPEIDFEQIKKLDILQTYWLLFEYMKNDFVHRIDFIKCLNTNTSSAGPVAFPLVADTSGAEGTAQAYKAAAETGGVVREGLVSGLEALTS